MKKLLLSLAVLALVICALVAALPLGGPALGGEAGLLAAGEGGRIYTAEARADANWVYAHSGGLVEEAWRIPAAVGTAPAPLRQLACDGQSLAALQSWQSEGATHWRLLQRAAGGGFEPVLEGQVEEGAPLPVLSCENGALWLAMLRPAGSGAVLYRVEEAEGGAVLTEAGSLAAPSGEAFTTATGLGGRLYALLADGRLYAAEGVVYPEAGQARLTLLKTNAGTLLAWDDKAGSALYTGGLVLAKLPELPGNEAVLDGAGAGEAEAVFLVARGDEHALLQLSGTGYLRHEALSTTFGVRLQLRLPLMLALLGALVLACLLGLLLYGLLRRCRSFAGSAVGLCALGLAALVLVLSGSAAALVHGGLQSAGLQEAEATSARLAAALAGDKTAALPAAGGEGLGVLVSGSSGGYALGGAPGYAMGMPVEAAFGRQLREMARVAESRNATVSRLVYTGRQAALYSLTPVTAGGGRALLLVRLPGEALQAGTLRFLQRCLLVSGGVALALLVVFLFIAAGMTAPLRALRRAMEQVAAGGRAPAEAAPRADEVGGAMLALREMAGALERQQYEVDAAIRSYRRFVPEGLEGFLGCESPVDTRAGDMAHVKGCVALAGVANRARVRSRLDDEHFMRFVGGCYAAVEESAGANQGVLLDGAFSLSGLKLCFAEGADAAGFSLALLNGEAAAGEDIGPSWFQLLHKASFLYGVTGSDKRVMNLISSSELDFLSEVCARFEKINCRLVVTDQFLRGLDIPLNTRYIGFVGSEDGRFTFKLHEVLDVYGSIERSRRQQYATRFQQAINQFYRGEFHTARNAFSSMLKICPTDGVARWYLYACEYYFNRQDTDNFNYSLFGARVE